MIANYSFLKNVKTHLITQNVQPPFNFMGKYYRILQKIFAWPWRLKILFWILPVENGVQSPKKRVG